MNALPALLKVRYLLDQVDRLQGGAIALPPNQRGELQKQLLGKAVIRLRQLDDTQPQLFDPQLDLLPPAELRAIAERCLRSLASRTEFLAAYQAERQRSLRIWGALAMAMLVAVCAAVAAYRIPRSMPGTLLRGQYSWRLSSALSGYPASGELSASPAGDFFFSTGHQKQPSIVLDLLLPTDLVGVEVTNRQDCCYDRALPLTVLLSDDLTTWRELARRTEPFYVWQIRVPQARARYVKLQVENESWLHLYQLRLFSQK
ncbi:MAG: hypothetical protein RJA70_100 [Pseudomonadota bacterium]|jgi:hypothetical protein